MTGRTRTSPILVLAVAVAVLTASSVSVSTADDGVAGAASWTYESEVAARLGDLPPEPDLAAMRLVDLVFDDDPRTGDYAVMELLRRSGIPILNLLDAVVAMPDHLVFFDAAFYGELVPLITQAVVEGDFYTLDDFNDVFMSGGALEEPVTPEQLATALGTWGKQAEDPAELRTVAAAIRALGAKRDMVYWSGASEPHLDPLQMVLLVSVLGGTVDELAPEPQSLLAAPETGPCEAFMSVYNNRRVVASTAAGVYWRAFIEFSGPVGPVVKAIRMGTDTAGTVATALVWLLNIRLRLDAKPGAVHFAHAPATQGNVVEVTATAEWRTPRTLGGLERPTSVEEASCWQALTTLKVFPDGPLPGFRVRFSLSAAHNSSGNIRLLRPLPGSADDFSPTGGGGVLTDGKGEARVTLESEIELSPPPPGASAPEVREQVTVIARLDKDEFPFAFRDLLLAVPSTTGSFDPRVAAGKKIIDILSSINNKLALPNRVIEIPVTYHGRDVLIIDAQTPLFMFYVSVGFKAQLYTCQGLSGRWQGEGGLTEADLEFWGELTNDAITSFRLGVTPIPETVAIGLVPIEANLDLTQGPDDLVVGNSTFGLRVEIDEHHQTKGSAGTVGTASLILADGTSLQAIMGILLLLGGSSTWPVVRVDPDSAEAERLCPDAGKTAFAGTKER